MRTVSLLDGKAPSANMAVTQVMMEEGSMRFLGWNVGDQQSVHINGAPHEVEIVGTASCRTWPERCISFVVI